VLSARLRRHGSEGLHAQVVATDPQFLRLGQMLADRLRRQLPDLDDVTIGRVVLEIGAAVGAYVGTSPEPDCHQLNNWLTLGGLDLTAVEWPSS
jgi:hypothetical protein